MDFLALILQAVQGANWQRAGAKGNPPKRVERPSDKPTTIKTSDDLRRRRAAAEAELERRRANRKLNKDTTIKKQQGA